MLNEKLYFNNWKDKDVACLIKTYRKLPNTTKNQLLLLKFSGLLSKHNEQLFLRNIPVGEYLHYQKYLEELIERMKPSRELPGWLNKIIPEDWRSDLEELRCELLNQGYSKLVINLITLRSLLEMLFAGLWIKWEDLISLDNKNRSREVAINAQRGDIADVQNKDVI